MDMIKAIVVCEGEYHNTVWFQNENEMSWYSVGLDTSANAYGDGSCHLLTLQDLDNEDYAEYHEMIRKYLGTPA